MSPDDQTFTNAVKRLLDEDLDAIDTVLASKLSAARHRALAAYKQPADRLRFAPYFPAVICTAALTMAIGLSDIAPPPILSNGDAIALEWVVNSPDLELIEELEFYQWLDAHGQSG